MSTLLLRLAAPLQAWGINSKFDIRKTEREPSKSGVVGLLAAALGRRRDESLDDLTALTFGIRSDKEGELLKDFHMVLKDKKTSYVTTRYYLADAIFLVGLESQDETFLKTLDQALQAPVFPLFLGRRSCPPTCHYHWEYERRICLQLCKKNRGKFPNGSRSVSNVNMILTPCEL
ncbi:MAG: type I-E CRISPR-associated protein Cas5/CasD [Acutalibacteraceae bacterium]